MLFRVLLLSVFMLVLSADAFAKMMSINGESVNLRSGPGTKYSVKWEYGHGFPVRTHERKGDWIKISDFERDTGWIHSSLLSNDRFVIVKVNRGSKKVINIRSEPTTSGAIVGKAHYGVVFKRLEGKSGWSKVRHDSGLIGWIKDSLIWGN